MSTFVNHVYCVEVTTTRSFRFSKRQQVVAYKGGRLREAVAHGGSTVEFIVQSAIPEHSFTGGNSSKGSGFLLLICFP